MNGVGIARAIKIALWLTYAAGAVSCLIVVGCARLVLS